MTAMPPPAERRRMKTATKEALQQQMKSWTKDMLVCRTYQHSWDGYTVDPEGVNLLVTLMCRRCESYKYQLLDGRTGHVINQSVDYPKGYLAKGLGRIVGEQRDQLRLETAMRTVKGKAARHLASVKPDAVAS